MQSGEETGGGEGGVAQDTVRETGVGQITQDLPGQDENLRILFLLPWEAIDGFKPKNGCSERRLE